MLLFLLAAYFVIALPVILLIWASLVVAKWDDKDRGYDLLEDR